VAAVPDSPPGAVVVLVDVPEQATTARITAALHTRLISRL
jgi:hypothetical protein